MMQYYQDKINDKILFKRNEIELLFKSDIKNVALTSYILCIESIHRESLILRLIENILAKIFPGYCKRKDFSLGPFQIKYSFCKKYKIEIESITELLDFSKSAKIVDRFIELHKGLSQEEILRLYHSGGIIDINYSTYLYSSLFIGYQEYFDRKHIFNV